MILNVPQSFPGTDEERAANRATHSFDSLYERCMRCDCRPWGAVAEWPCGQEPPRTTLDVDDAVAYVNARRAGVSA